MKSQKDVEESFHAGQTRILEMFAADAPLPDILKSIVLLMEAQVEGMLCSTLVLTTDGRRVRHGAAPSLPEAYVKAVYHLNAEEEPELPDYPKDPAYLAKFGPRGVLKCKATDKDDPTVDPRFGKIGKQTIEDTGALTKKRMETVDDETSAAATRAGIFAQARWPPANPATK